MLAAGSLVVGALIGFGLVVGAVLIIFGIHGRGPKKPPRNRPQVRPRKSGDNPFQDVVERGRR